MKFSSIQENEYITSPNIQRNHEIYEEVNNSEFESENISDLKYRLRTAIKNRIYKFDERTKIILFEGFRSLGTQIKIKNTKNEVDVVRNTIFREDNDFFEDKVPKKSKKLQKNQKSDFFLKNLKSKFGDSDSFYCMILDSVNDFIVHLDCQFINPPKSQKNLNILLIEDSVKITDIYTLIETVFPLT